MVHPLSYFPLLYLKIYNTTAETTKEDVLRFAREFLNFAPLKKKRE